MDKPTIKPSSRIRAGSGGGGSNIKGPSTYTGGKFLFPVVGGNNYISQYFHYGHYAIDIAADYGTTVRAAAAAAPSPSPAGRATAAGTRSGSPTAPGCTRPTTTCRRSRSGAASTSGVASRSAGSASPATRRVRTATSRSGVAPSGTAAAREPARLPVGRILPRPFGPTGARRGACENGPDVP